MIDILGFLVNSFSAVVILLEKLFFYPFMFFFIVIYSLETPLMPFSGTALRRKSCSKRHQESVMCNKLEMLRQVSLQDMVPSELLSLLALLWGLQDAIE